MNDVNVQLVDFHITTSYEMVCQNEDGSYTILLNSRQADNQIKKACQHALRHIENGDFEKRGSVQEIEYDAHNQ